MTVLPNQNRFIFTHFLFCFLQLLCVVFSIIKISFTFFFKTFVCVSFNSTIFLLHISFSKRFGLTMNNFNSSPIWNLKPYSDRITPLFLAVIRRRIDPSSGRFCSKNTAVLDFFSAEQGLVSPCIESISPCLFTEKSP
jgi:hypothetical protein